MAALKNNKHEMFCQEYMSSPKPFLRYNATWCYRSIYLNASYKTAMANGPLLRARHQGRLDEIYEEQKKLQGGYQLVDYRRGVVKKYKPYAKSNNKKLNPSPPSPIDQPQKAQNKAKATHFNPDLEYMKYLPKESEPKALDWDDVL